MSKAVKRKYNHRLLKVSIGQIISHDPCTMERIIWNKSELELGNDNSLHLVSGRSNIRCRSKIELKKI